MKKKIPVKESETVEFKTSFDKETVETVSAFANTEGGSIFIGITDGGTKSGITLGKETVQQWVNQIKLSTSPSIVPDFIIRALSTII